MWVQGSVVSALLPACLPCSDFGGLRASASFDMVRSVFLSIMPPSPSSSLHRTTTHSYSNSVPVSMSDAGHRASVPTEEDGEQAVLGQIGMGRGNVTCASSTILSALLQFVPAFERFL
jgi:hypothetical protein